MRIDAEDFFRFLFGTCFINEIKVNIDIKRGDSDVVPLVDLATHWSSADLRYPGSE